jgi:general secretion pathway protein I
MNTRGFTLLEMLVATVIMGVAVVALLGNISTSMRHATDLTEYDRAALLARRTMDQLLLDPRLPGLTPFGAEYDPGLTGGVPSGWNARLTVFQGPPHPALGASALERLELEIWWMRGRERRNVILEGFRRSMLPRGGAAAPGAQP